VNLTRSSLERARDSFDRFDETPGKREYEHHQAEPDEHDDQVYDANLHWAEHPSPHWLDFLILGTARRDRDLDTSASALPVRSRAA
jgi:hypothetical protein